MEAASARDGSVSNWDIWSRVWGVGSRVRGVGLVRDQKMGLNGWILSTP
jgi:hypothetical protein